MKSYKYKEACFACTTPYQVMGAISITINKQLDADLYIFGMFPNYQVVAEKLRNYNYFSNVYAVDCSKIGTPSRVEGFRQMLFAESTVSFYLPKEVAYHTYYSSSRALPKTILQQVLLRRNPHMNRVIYEDGMGTYAKDSHPLNPTKLKSAAEKLLGWNLDNPKNTSMMAYVPQLVEVPEYLKGHTVEQMPRLKFDEDITNMLEDIFSVNQTEHIKKKYIIFDTLRPDTANLNNKDLEILDECYDIISHFVGRSKVIIKTHPRSRISSNSNIEIYRNQEIPMEILYVAMPDLDQKVLVSFASSAIFTPKILFDKEPLIISLHRILHETSTSILFETIYNKFRGIYSNKDRVLAPVSFDELEKILLKVQGEKNI